VPAAWSWSQVLMITAGIVLAGLVIGLVSRR
jgi:hypothetical protein